MAEKGWGFCVSGRSRKRDVAKRNYWTIIGGVQRLNATFGGKGGRQKSEKEKKETLRRRKPEGFSG